jgi:hypothetical protein
MSRRFVVKSLAVPVALGLGFVGGWFAHQRPGAVAPSRGVVSNPAVTVNHRPPTCGPLSEDCVFLGTKIPVVRTVCQEGRATSFQFADTIQTASDWKVIVGCTDGTRRIVEIVWRD